jgi:hypothetical protein
MLLGVASVPMSPLLHNCWVDGYAPVYALMTRAAGADGAPLEPGEQQEEKVQVGVC